MLNQSFQLPNFSYASFVPLKEALLSGQTGLRLWESTTRCCENMFSWKKKKKKESSNNVWLMLNQNNLFCTIRRYLHDFTSKQHIRLLQCLFPIFYITNFILPRKKGERKVSKTQASKLWVVTNCQSSHPCPLWVTWPMIHWGQARPKGNLWCL